MRPFREESLDEKVERARNDAYRQFCPPTMSRAERRTAKGKMLVAQAEAAALRAEIEVLRENIADT